MAPSVARLPNFLSAIALILQLTTAASSPSCSFVISSGDAALGIRVVSDSTCASGGVGCINDICRFCKTLDNDASGQFILCSSFSALDSCTVSQGKYDAGINAIDDATCVNGGLGCYNDQCRYCRFQNTTQSAYLNACPTISSSSTLAPVTPTQAPTTPTPAPTTSTPTPTSALATPTPTPTPVRSAPVTLTPTTSIPITTATPTPVPTTSVAAPAISLICSELVTTGDAAFGIDILTDISCFEGGSGCFNNVCRYCRRQTTTRSASFMDCSDVDSTAGFDINFVPLPVFLEAPAPTSTASIPTPSPVDKSTASCTVSSGDAATGVGAFADASCATGGLGCYTTTCRFCQLRLTSQSVAYGVCSSTVQMLRAATQPQHTGDNSDQWAISIGAVGVGAAAIVVALLYAVAFSSRRQIRRHLVIGVMASKEIDPTQEEGA